MTTASSEFWDRILGPQGRVDADSPLLCVDELDDDSDDWHQIFSTMVVVERLNYLVLARK